jgi:hypothetical protein
MNSTAPSSTHLGEPWSIIHPNSNGPMMPPMLKPVETMANTRPTAPGGAARRTSMSRQGWIRPKMTPERPIAAISAGTDSVTVATSSMITAATPKPSAAMSPCRLMRSASAPPMSTPTAEPAR